MKNISDNNRGARYVCTPHRLSLEARQHLMAGGTDVGEKPGVDG